MGFEFDKEIDILLRQARKGETVFTATIPQSAHLDADEISAFAENALPEKAKQVYTTHLADCDSCRKSLSDLILLNAENEIALSPENVVVALPPTIPWYRKLFALPNLAYTLGALIVLFGGIVGFTVLRNLTNSQNAEVAQINEKPQISRQTPSESAAETSESNISANSNTVVKSNTATVYQSNSMISDAPKNSNMSVAPNKPVPSSAKLKKAEPSRENDLAAVNKQGESFAPGEAKTERNNEAPTSNNLTAAGLTARKKPAEDESSNDKNATKPETSINRRQISELPVNGRQTGELQSSPAAKSDLKKAKNSDATGNAATIVGSKTFNRKSSVWYDANYNQQSTINITRGTEKYKKLDKELRTIVENLGGTVVIVWKDKAYRIQ